MKKYIYSMAIAATVFSAASCSDEVVNGEVPVTPEGQKEMIRFSSDGTEGLASESATRAGFSAETDMVMRIQSDNRTNASDTKYTRTTATANVQGLGKYYSSVGTNGFLARYWDDAHGRNSLLSVYAVAVPNKHFSDTELTATSLSGTDAWASETDANNSLTWGVSTSTITTANIENEDLVYSNNIQANENLGKNGRYVWDYSANKHLPEELTADNVSTLGSKRMRFTQSGKLEESSTLGTEAGHFDRGHLHFQHALSRLTIKIVEGEGFVTTGDTKNSDFKWTNGGSVVTNNNLQILSGTVGTKGTLNVKTGEWSATEKNAITTLAALGTSISTTGTFEGEYVDAAGYYRAQMLPDFVFNNEETTNVLQFSIDNNTYYITQGMIYSALAGVDANKTAANGWKDAVTDPASPAHFKMMQGKNYVLEITVKKTGIQAITATVAEWVDVQGATSINNAHLSFSLATSGSACTNDIDLYRLEDNNPGFNADQYNFSYKGYNWKGNYLTDDQHKVTLLNANKTTEGKWSTSWFFESNKTYYHFRTVNKDTPIVGNTGTGADAQDDYFEIEGSESGDPHWGAPFDANKASDDSENILKYDNDNGFKYVHYAIGATESDVNIQEIHMMSNIKVILKTQTEGKVSLYQAAVGETPAKETVVKITRLSKQGKVYMGNGKVEPIAPTSPTTYNDFEHTMKAPEKTSATTYYKTSDTETNPYTFAVVPQELCRVANSTSDDDYVGIFIQTPDNNQYYVIQKLSTITASTVDDQRNQTKDEKITRWFPGHSYTYTITITKTGIKAITATVADWVNVTGQNIDINLED